MEAYVFEATIATNSQLDNHPNKFHVNIPASEEGVSTVYEKALSQLLWNGYTPKSMMDMPKRL